MQADRRINNKIGVVSEEDIPLVEPSEVINFFEKMLMSIVTEIEDDDEEDIITQKLVQVSIATDSLFVCLQQHKNKGVKSSEDIAISTKLSPTKVFFVIEAKRLPSSRKKEYIIGSTGGIERFKREKHAKKFNYAGMIGYVQKDTFSSWENKINSWIDEEISLSTSTDLTWNSCEKLTTIKSTDILAKYVSSHSCLSKKHIHLTHLWINLVK